MRISYEYTSHLIDLLNTLKKHNIDDNDFIYVIRGESSNYYDPITDDSVSYKPIIDYKLKTTNVNKSDQLEKMKVIELIDELITINQQV